MSTGKTQLPPIDETPSHWARQPAGAFSRLPFEILVLVCQRVTIGDLERIVATCKRMCAAVADANVQNLLTGYYHWRRLAFAAWRHVTSVPCYTAAEDCEVAEMFPNQPGISSTVQTVRDHAAVVCQHYLYIYRCFCEVDIALRKRRVSAGVPHGAARKYVDAVNRCLAFKWQSQIDYIFVCVPDILRENANDVESKTLQYLSVPPSERRYLYFQMLEHHLNIPLTGRLVWPPDRRSRRQFGRPILEGPCRGALLQLLKEIISCGLQSQFVSSAVLVTNAARSRIERHLANGSAFCSHPLRHPNFLLRRRS